MTSHNSYQDDYEQLLANLKKLSHAVVAFSGGVDSTLLLWAAKEALGDKVLALTVKTPYIPDWEIEEAASFCREHDIRHEVIELPFPVIIRGNPEDRCYKCKKQLFEKLLEIASARGIDTVLEGTNADDMDDYRPGLRALRELKIISPLLESGLTKAVVRAVSKSVGLVTWDKPAYACLLTRLPYNQDVDDNTLVSIEKAELFLIRSGYRAVRVRVQDNTARIEMDSELMPRFITSGFYMKATAFMKSLGFRFISLDLEGYRKGSFNSTLEK
jgi:uncharacterized protein